MMSASKTVARRAQRNSIVKAVRSRKTAILAAAAFGALGTAASSFGQLYWDTNGATDGSAVTTGTWGASSFWTLDATGNSLHITSIELVS